MANKLFQVLFF